MEVVATAKWVRTTARKARLVTHMVEGLPVAEALVVLRFSPRSAARDVAKVIKSAAANAEHNYSLDATTLRVARVEVDDATIIKRWRAKPRGMVGSIFKRTSHLRAFVTDEEQPAHLRRRRAVLLPRAAVPLPTVAPSASAPAQPRRRRPAASDAAVGDDAPAGAPRKGTTSATDESTVEEQPKRAPRRRKPAPDPAGENE